MGALGLIAKKDLVRLFKSQDIAAEILMTGALTAMQLIRT